MNQMANMALSLQTTNWSDVPLATWMHLAALILAPALFILQGNGKAKRALTSLTLLLLASLAALVPGIDALSDDVLILHEGELVADGPTEAITRMESGERIDLIVAPGDVQLDPDRVQALVADTPGVVTVTSQPGAELEPGQVALRVRAETDIRGELFRTVARNGLVLLEIKRERTNLEEVFRNLTLGAPPSENPADQPAQA